VDSKSSLNARTGRSCADRGPGVVEDGVGEQVVEQRRSDERPTEHRRARGVQLMTVDLHDVTSYVSFVRHSHVS